MSQWVHGLVTRSFEITVDVRVGFRWKIQSYRSGLGDPFDERKLHHEPLRKLHNHVIKERAFLGRDCNKTTLPPGWTVGVVAGGLFGELRDFLSGSGT